MWNSLGFFHLVIYISLEIRLFIFHIFVLVSSELSTNQRASIWHATTLKITPSLIGQGAIKQHWMKLIELQRQRVCMAVNNKNKKCK